MSLVRRFYHDSSPRPAPEFSLFVKYTLEQNEEKNRAEDIIFRTTLSARNAPVTGIDSIVGPTIAMVPILARITSGSTISEFLGQLRDHTTAMIPYEQTGVQNIAKINLLDFVRHVKDCIRAVPQSGFPFFTSKLSSQEAANEFASSLLVEVMFNYGGRYQQLERKDSFFRNAPIPEDTPSQAAGYTRYALFDVLVNVTDASLGVAFIYDDSIAANHEVKIQSWIDGYQAIPNQLASTLSVEPRQWTLTDMPNVFDLYDSITEFQEDMMPELGIRDLDDIEDIFPCAPTQEGILINQAKDSTSYRSRVSIKESARAGRVVDVSRLRKALAAVV
ncbi:hypothetical protein NM208_g166 [Fusarium decemcellulare]|uniref:Uncharacterized protein n=1 Tax=Fusarium decemcellulare TaxID=57161 RepID=A0ACC1T0G9_9HYPO|nr:hypothetical protein NM208_g166 [Fusarium decemcellulare]